jgi:Yip1 domain
MPPPVLTSLALTFRAVFDPTVAVPAAVERRAFGFPILLLVLAVSASGAAVAYRLDPSPVVTQGLEAKGELKKASEREVSDEIQQAQRVALVGGVAKGLLAMPLLALLAALVLKIVGWVLGRKVLYAEALTTVGLALIPAALFHLILAAVALKQPVIVPSMIASLLPSSLADVASFQDAGPKALKVLKAFDFFNLWGAGLLGLGFAQAAKWRPWQGLVFGAVVYALFAGAFLIGLPALAAGAGPGGGGQ